MSAEAALDQPLGVRIEVAGGLVENEDRGVGYVARAMARRDAGRHQLDPALADPRVVAFGKLVDELIGMGDRRGRSRPAERGRA
ncbi:MAG: hypothetical protein U0794_19280 [Isosphaeraceae bacterium]